MQPKEIEKLLKLCVKLGVSEFKLGEFHVIFSEIAMSARKPRKAVIKDQEKTAKAVAISEMYERIQDEIATSHIEDPLGYETAIAEGLLEREETRYS